MKTLPAAAGSSCAARGANLELIEIGALPAKTADRDYP